MNRLKKALAMSLPGLFLALSVSATENGHPYNDQAIDTINDLIESVADVVFAGLSTVIPFIAAIAGLFFLYRFVMSQIR